MREAVKRAFRRVAGWFGDRSLPVASLLSAVGLLAIAAVAESQGRQVGRPPVVDPKVLTYATHLRSTGSTMSEIVEATNLSRATLYRHLPTRPSLHTAPTVTGTAATR